MEIIDGTGWDGVKTDGIGWDGIKTDGSWDGKGRECWDGGGKEGEDSEGKASVPDVDHRWLNRCSMRVISTGVILGLLVLFIRKGRKHEASGVAFCLCIYGPLKSQPVTNQ